jgi:type IV pilus assembly protein PilE
MIYSKFQPGFSYIELVVALVIFVVLATVAYPSYQDSILRIRRAEARSALHSVLLQQERYYTAHNTYFAFSADTNNSPFKWWSGDSPSGSYYEIQATPCANKLLVQCVLLTATPGTENVRRGDDPECGNLMLDSASKKTYSADTVPNSSCW